LRERRFPQFRGWRFNLIVTFQPDVDLPPCLFCREGQFFSRSISGIFGSENDWPLSFWILGIISGLDNLTRFLPSLSTCSMTEGGRASFGQFSETFEPYQLTDLLNVFSIF